MTTYEVTDADGNTVTAGSTVTSFRGEGWVFGSVSRGTEYNGTAKVVVHDPAGSPGDPMGEREFYAQVFDLTVVTVTR